MGKYLWKATKDFLVVFGWLIVMASVIAVGAVLAKHYPIGFFSALFIGFVVVWVVWRAFALKKHDDVVKGIRQSRGWP